MNPALLSAIENGTRPAETLADYILAISSAPNKSESAIRRSSTHVLSLGNESKALQFLFIVSGAVR